MDVLSHAAMLKTRAPGFLHVSGLTWTNNKGIPEHVMVGGVPIELERMYKVVTTDALAGGVLGYTMFKEASQLDTGFALPSAIRDYIKKAGKVAPQVEGRLTIIE